MECICSLLTYLGGSLLQAFGSSVQRQAEDGLNRFGERVTEAVRDLIHDRGNRVVWEPTATPTIVGAEETLKAIYGHLNGNEVDAIGIVGIGGVGKTTLLNKINNDLHPHGAGKFDIVIFATVSSEGDAVKVQKKIGDRLGLSQRSSEADFNRVIYDALSHKRFLLLLDDVWGELNLKEIGVPFPNKENGCKIALTTRTAAVFSNFLGTWCWPRERSRVVEVTRLNEDKSWELFHGMVDPHVNLNDPSIRPHAEMMVAKCGGLPLALVTMGGAMTRATTPAAWRKARRQLKESPYRLQGMNEVQSKLMFSIDRLEKGTLLPCFLYCSLFPEDYNIPEERLIECWIGVGFLDTSKESPSQAVKEVDGSIYDARDEGEIMIEELKDRCLLETSSVPGCVKMHDLLREVALILCRKANMFLVYLDGNEGPLTDIPNRESVTTLLMRRRYAQPELLDSFFPTMCNLVVLDLSDTRLETFPTSICSLLGLRYLSVRRTKIDSLPKELGHLVKLRQLDLSGIRRLQSIPLQAISRLHRLQVLNMLQSGYKWGREGSMIVGGGGAGDVDEGMPLCERDLVGLVQLQDLSLDVHSLELLSDTRLSSLTSSITQLGLIGVSDLTTHFLVSALRSMGRLRVLTMENCENLAGELILDGGVLCELEDLCLLRAPLLSAIVFRGTPQKLGCLSLAYLPNLDRIFVDDASHRLPSLRYLDVYFCGLLRALPLPPRSEMRNINCQETWWEGLPPDQRASWSAICPGRLSLLPSTGISIVRGVHRHVSDW